MCYVICYVLYVIYYVICIYIYILIYAKYIIHKFIFYICVSIFSSLIINSMALTRIHLQTRPMPSWPLMPIHSAGASQNLEIG